MQSGQRQRYWLSLPCTHSYSRPHWLQIVTWLSITSLLLGSRKPGRGEAPCCQSIYQTRCLSAPHVPRLSRHLRAMGIIHTISAKSSYLALIPENRRDISRACTGAGCAALAQPAAAWYTTAMFKRWTRRERDFRLHYPGKEARGLRLCERNGHDMFHDQRWRGRVKGLQERYVCRTCGQVMVIECNPAPGYGQVHGPATAIGCVKKREITYNG